MVKHWPLVVADGRHWHIPCYSLLLASARWWTTVEDESSENVKVEVAADHRRIIWRIRQINVLKKIKLEDDAGTRRAGGASLWPSWRRVCVQARRSRSRQRGGNEGKFQLVSSRRPAASHQAPFKQRAFKLSHQKLEEANIRWTAGRPLKALDSLACREMSN